MNSSSLYSIVIIIAVLVLWRRTRAMYRPMKGNGARLLFPVIFLLLPSLYILNLNAHATAWEWICAVIFGFLLSIPLIWTTKYELRSDQYIYAVRNTSFIITFLIIFLVRLLPWRIISFIKFRQLYKRRLRTNDNIDFR